MSLAESIHKIYFLSCRIFHSCCVIFDFIERHLSLANAALLGRSLLFLHKNDRHRPFYIYHYTKYVAGIGIIGRMQKRQLNISLRS